MIWSVLVFFKLAYHLACFEFCTACQTLLVPLFDDDDDDDGYFHELSTPFFATAFTSE